MIANKSTISHLLVSFQIALVTGGVVAAGADVVLLSAVHGQVSLQQRLAAEVSSAVPTLVAGSVEDQHVIAKRRLALEHDRAALELLVGLVVHRRHVPLQVVLPVGQVATLRTAEQPLAGRRRGRKPRLGWSAGQPRRGHNVEVALGGEGMRRTRGNRKDPSSVGGSSSRSRSGGDLPVHDCRQ